MRISPEIKDFTKNTLIFTLFFTLVIHLGWGYLVPYLSQGAGASNESTFRQVNTTYLGGLATALSLKIGKTEDALTGNQNENWDSSVTIEEVLSNPKEGERKLIANNMLAMQSYLNVLKIDIGTLLEESSDRGLALDEHIEILKSYYNSTAERTAVLAEQSRDLEAILANSATRTEAAKGVMEEKYRSFVFDGVDAVIDDYVDAKNSENRARVYLAYVKRFQRGYGVLQGENRKILDTLINNRDAIIKQATVVVPDSGTDLLKKLNLLVTEEEYDTLNARK